MYEPFGALDAQTFERSDLHSIMVVESRDKLPHYAGIKTFLKMPFLEDVNRVDEYDVAMMVVPFDIGDVFTIANIE
jgi:hypothetical protein